jgi:hypothetical protein
MAAANVMKDAYGNIMENFVDDFSGEKVVNEKDETKEIIIDSESEKIESDSDELDDLLKR